MSKKILALFLILLVLFIAAACGTTNTKTQLGGTFIGGANGVSIAFKETAPITEFQKKDSVPVTVILKNTGEHDLNVEEAKAKIFGVSLENFGLTSAKQYKGITIPLKRVSSLNPEGGEQEVNFGNINYKLDITGSDVSYTLMARVCYPYQTDLFTSVCMRSKMLEDIDTGICSFGNKLATSDVSSGPIQVTSVTEETRGSDQVKFNIKIENKGTGKVYSSTTTCDELDKNIIKAQDLENKISYEVITTGVKCGSAESNKGEITLVPVEKGATSYTLSCWKTVDQVYEDKLNLKLNYIYTSDTSKQIKIYKTL